MRSFVSLLVLSGLLLAGCESMTERVQERFAAVAPKVRDFDGEQRTVYYAAQLAFKRLDFVLTSSSLGSAHIEAGSRIHTSEAFGDSRQLVAQVHLSEVAPGRTEVALTLQEQVENASLGGPSQQPLREHAFFETYFATLEAVLLEQSAELAAKKN
ncbi:MAG: hypothetical protein HYV95_13405 [Opitutae bacterium]|nr:hypothetical protein [Opitutae bacterium]